MSNVALFPTDSAQARQFSEADVFSRLEAERMRIARELHDVVAYSLATIIVQAGVADRLIDDRPQQAGEALRAIKSAGQTALHEFRTILGTLREPDAPPKAAPGLGRLDHLAASITSAGVPTSVIVYGDRRNVPVEVDRAAFRIVQESLTNVVRHAHGATARVVISYARESLVLTINNDDHPEASPRFHRPGNGIRGMRERAELLGGNLHAGPRPYGGFRVSAKLPTSLRR